MRTPSIPDTLDFIRAAHGGAAVGGQPRWVRSLEVMGLLPMALPGIAVTHADRQVALLRDILATTDTTELALVRAGYPRAVVDSVVRLSPFDADFPCLDHLRAVAASRDLSAIRATTADLLHGEKFGAAAAADAAAEARELRTQAMAILRRLEGGNRKAALSGGRRPTLSAGLHAVASRAADRDPLPAARSRQGGGARDTQHKDPQEQVRERAYALWEMAGRPEGRADEFWQQAQRHRIAA